MRGDSVAHIMQEITDPKLAAAIISIDVPLNPNAPLRVIAGDGIATQKIIWQFAGASPTGNTADVVAKAWFDESWNAKNPTHTLARIKVAFAVMAAMAEQSKGGAEYVSKHTGGDTIKTASTPAAATIVALGHPCNGWSEYSGST